MTPFGQTIGKMIVAGALFLGSLLGYHQPQNLSATIYKPVPRYESSLALALDAVTTSSMTMVSGVDGNGMTLTGPMCFTLDSGVAGKVEDICGTASGTVVTGLLRGTDSSGYVASSTLAHTHRVGADVKTTDSPYLPQYYGFLNGSNAFPNPLKYDVSVTNASITANNQNLVNYALLASTSIAGAVPATNANAGIAKIATSSDLANGNTTTTYSLVPDARSFSSSSVSSTTYQVPVAVSGSLSTGFICQSASCNYNFLGGIASASTTLNGSTTIPNATSSILTTNASGTLTKIGAPTNGTGTVLAYSNGAWGAGIYQVYAVSSMSTTTVANINYSTTTIPTLTPNAVYDIFEQIVTSQNGTGTSTVQFGGNTLCQQHNSGQTINVYLKLTMQNSASYGLYNGNCGATIVVGSITSQPTLNVQQQLGNTSGSVNTTSSVSMIQ